MKSWPRWFFILLFLISATTPALHGSDPNPAPKHELGTDSSVLPPAPALLHVINEGVILTQRRHPPRTLSEWETRRGEVSQALRQSLGLATWPTRTALNVQSHGKSERAGYSIERLTFESRPGLTVTALLYRPDSNVAQPRHPAMLCPIGHWLTPGKTAPEVQARCIQLARMGIIALSYDAIGQGERMVAGNRHHEAGYALLPLGETIAGWMVWDSMRAIDLLQGLPDVDPQRIGITGNSGGGLNSLLTAALDDRIQVATVVGFTYSFQNWLPFGGTHCTCTHWPGIVNEMEWFEIAGLIAPRAALLLQGDRDGIFLISGARRAARDTASIYRVMEAPAQFRFMELSNQRHAYGQPYRAAMYAWVAEKWNLPKTPATLEEHQLDLLPEQDPQILCDPQRRWQASIPTVVQLAQEKAIRLESERLSKGTEQDRQPREWVQQLVAPPAEHPHFLAPQVIDRTVASDGIIERVSFATEDGVRLAAKLFFPPDGIDATQAIIVCDARGIENAESHLEATRLQQAGCVALVVDLRGRGEQLMRHRDRWDINFRLVAGHVLIGKPLAGRRAYDLLRAIDYLTLRTPRAIERLTLWGRYDDSLPSLLATIVDPRIDQLIFEQGLSSFRSQMVSDRSYRQEEMGDHWNDPQVTGKLVNERVPDGVDLGSVIPGSLLVADVPDLVEQLGTRRILAASIRDASSPLPPDPADRFKQAVGRHGEYRASSLTGTDILAWVTGSNASAAKTQAK